MTQWIRYRFHADPDDYRPVKFPPPGPCWCSGYGEDYSVMIAYLPEDEDLSEYWPECSEVETELRNRITYTSRFPKPDWWAGE